MEKIFLDQTQSPDTAALQAALGDCYRLYEELLEMTNRFDGKWTFYKGWSYKVFHESKALCYIAPGNECFEVNMAIREDEKAALLKDDLSDDVEEMVKHAEKAAEGYALKFLVRNKMSFNRLKRVLALIIPRRLA